jgi:putative membrane protein insertion efficiency factor
MKYLSPKYFFVFLIRLYKILISPLLPSSCKHYPTCSDYAIESLKKYGVIKGGYLAALRVLKCNPFYKGGYDPVP